MTVRVSRPIPRRPSAAEIAALSGDMKTCPTVDDIVALVQGAAKNTSRWGIYPAGGAPNVYGFGSTSVTTSGTLGTVSGTFDGLPITVASRFVAGSGSPFIRITTGDFRNGVHRFLVFMGKGTTTAGHVQAYFGAFTGLRFSIGTTRGYGVARSLDFGNENYRIVSSNGSGLTASVDTEIASSASGDFIYAEFNNVTQKARFLDLDYETVAGPWDYVQPAGVITGFTNTMFVANPATIGLDFVNTFGYGHSQK